MGQYLSLGEEVGHHGCLDSVGDMSVLEYDEGALAPQLQTDGLQVFCRCSHDLKQAMV